MLRGAARRVSDPALAPVEQERPSRGRRQAVPPAASTLWLLDTRDAAVYSGRGEQHVTYRRDRLVQLCLLPLFMPGWSLSSD